MLHPILQEVRSRGIVTAIRTQPELVRVRDTQGVTGAHANLRVFERDGEIRRPLTARGDRNGRLSGLSTTLRTRGSPRRCRRRSVV